MHFLWPELGPRPGDGPPESFVLFATRGGRKLRLASSCEYEVFLDGELAGDGGHRSTAGEAPLDEWDATRAGAVLVRIHWIDGTRTELNARRAHEDAFLAVEEPAAWECALDVACRSTPTQLTRQLARQNVVTGPPTRGGALSLRGARLSRPWRCVELGVRRPRLVPIPLAPAAPRASSAAFDPCAADDLAALPSRLSREGLPLGIVCTTYDLGRIALHRVEATTGRAGVALAWSEVPRFEDAWATSSRAKVKLVDAVAANVARGAPFGWRGGRYLHVVHAADAPPALRAWRREYPLDWLPVSAADERDAPIVEACRANLVACTDGGLVDTCWRERGQWTGDLRLSARAVRALARNPEVVDLALRQIGASYVESAAMVEAVAPAVPRGGRPLFIPCYHPAWALSVVEHGVARLPAEAALARRSLDAWRALYARDGLLRGFPEGCWWFVDWTPPPPGDPGVADAVTHAWAREASSALGLAPLVDSSAFEAIFALGDGYRLFATDSSPSPQATAAAVLASLSKRPDAALDWLEAEHAAGRIATCVTPYFATFLAQAIGTRSGERMRAFIRDLYLERARRWGTIPEKTHDDSSLAHGWSVGVADLLLAR